MFIWRTFGLNLQSRVISVLYLWISYVCVFVQNARIHSGLFFRIKFIALFSQVLGTNGWEKEKRPKKIYISKIFIFFQNRCLVQWYEAPLVMLAVWFDSCEAHPFCKNISESFGSWKSFCLVGGRMDGWLDFFKISCPFTSQSVLAWVQFPIEPLIYFLFH